MMDLKKAPFFLDDKQLSWVESTLAGLSAEEKAGQLFCVMGGDYSPATLKDMVEKGRVGAILFRPVKDCVKSLFTKVIIILYQHFFP